MKTEFEITCSLNQASKTNKRSVSTWKYYELTLSTITNNTGLHLKVANKSAKFKTLKHGM